MYRLPKKERDLTKLTVPQAPSFMQKKEKEKRDIMDKFNSRERELNSTKKSRLSSESPPTAA